MKLLVAVDVKEVSEAGPVMQDDNVKVSAIMVEHPPVKPALGYGFDFKDRSIAFFGDTTPFEAVAKLAKGADVLVHEAMGARQAGDGSGECRLAQHTHPRHFRCDLLQQLQPFSGDTILELTEPALPPGRARLVTSPSLTGSSATPNTIGIVEVAALAAIAAALLAGVAITATRRRTSPDISHYRCMMSGFESRII
jgi:hypothetical protein